MSTSAPPAFKGQILSTLPPLLVGCSTKMYFTHARTVSYLHSLLSLPVPPPSLSLFYIPTFPSLSAVHSDLSSALAQSQTSAPATSQKLLLGAQDCHWEAFGAHTGSVSPNVLAELGCSIVELGHAERKRPPLSEGEALVASKARAAVNAGLVPLVCVGETAQGDSVEQGVELALGEVEVQVRSILESLPGEAHVIFAYEPVWAIGAAQPAPAAHVRGVVEGIKEVSKTRKGDVRVLYGGSAGPGTWAGLKGALDGLFLGRFGHDIDNVIQVMKEMEG